MHPWSDLASLRCWNCMGASNSWATRSFPIGRDRPPPNALPIPAIVENAKTDESILFLRTYGYLPNGDAAERLISRIWPEIVKRNPQAGPMIAGKRPNLILSLGLKPLGVEFTGFNAAVSARSDCCCPVTIGGGTRIKFLEAAGYARPIVSTAIGAEGLARAANEEILIRDTDD
jgi:hypothetical protein